ncbi:HK97-gp10 family putative phage morphogenesis protein [Lactococcus garvieae]|uniref:HK97-gp10 family putative phage morphogenesis protein n=1 Tax=Lactococcus garvieae TaxID=1363 RepID=UPI003852F1D3
MAVKYENDFNKAMDMLDKNVEAVLIASSEIVRSQAKANVTAAGRVDTGKLRDDIDYKLRKDGQVVGDMVSDVGSPDNHAIYNELGTGEFADNGAGRKGGWYYPGSDGKMHFTKGLKPIHFMRNAFRSTKSEVQSVMKSGLGKGLE